MPVKQSDRGLFVDHGVPAEVVESRTAAVCRDQTGAQRVVIAAKGFVLIVDPETGWCEQLSFPEGNEEYPYMCYADSSRGCFYTGAGPWLLVIDPFRACYVHAEAVGEAEELVGFSFAEAADGAVYVASYPQAKLYQYADGVVTSYGRMDPQEKYPSHLAADRSGWVYIGVGTERRNVIAYHPGSGERRSLVAEDERTRGMGVVYAAEEGAVYGHWSFSDLREVERKEAYRWMRFSEGDATEVAWTEVPDSAYTGSVFHKLHRQLEGAWRVAGHDLAERELVLEAADGSGRKVIPLAYRCEGAQLSPLTAGPDGHIYGTSKHPLHLYRFDVANQRLHSYGGKAIERGGGGNLAAYAVTGALVAGAAYAGGHLHLLDTSKPVELAGEARNPRLVTSHAEVHRPRCALAHSDGAHVVYGGFPGYGAVGGGLCIYNVETGEDRLLTHEQVVPYHSTLCLAETPDGDLYGGTSVETPGGATPRATRAKLYRLDWRERRVSESWSPVEAREIVWIYAGEGGLIHGMTSGSLYFAFDPVAGKLVAEQDCSAWGEPVRPGLAWDTEGRGLVAMSGAIAAFDPERCTLEQLAKPPVKLTAGWAYAGGRWFFGSGSHLWSYEPPRPSAGAREEDSL